jgi:predicted dehydrogenase
MKTMSTQRRSTQRRSTHRREFLKSTAAAGVGFWIAGTARAQTSNSPNERIRFACIGIGGKGDSDTADAAKFGEVVAICDVDEKTLNRGAKKYPKAAKFHDWRKLLDEMAGQIDAVTISTPDHSHAVAAAAAMRLKKHAFVQKPLTHSLYEARTLSQLAREQKVATQMGNQGTAAATLRQAAATVKSGVLGPVREVHAWTDRPIWPQGHQRSIEKSVPNHVHWDLFVGPAPLRPYGDHYHDFKWRGWWDFGTGALGDMACHVLNMPFMALDLRDPISVQAETSGHNRDSFPLKSKITYEFAATDRHPALKLYWYDGKQLPPRELLEKFDERKLADNNTERKPRNFADNGFLVIGEKAMLYSPDSHVARFELSGVDQPNVSILQPLDHFEEFVHAIKTGDPATSNFPDYAVPLTETVLLGNVAVWTATEAGTPGKKIEWDAKNLTATNAPEVAQIIRREYRAGYSI